MIVGGGWFFPSEHIWIFFCRLATIEPKCFVITSYTTKPRNRCYSFITIANIFTITLPFSPHIWYICINAHLTFFSFLLTYTMLLDASKNVLVTSTYKSAYSILFMRHLVEIFAHRKSTRWHYAVPCHLWTDLYFRELSLYHIASHGQPASCSVVHYHLSCWNYILVILLFDLCTNIANFLAASKSNLWNSYMASKY